MSEASVPAARTRVAALGIMAVLTVIFVSLAVRSFGAADVGSAVLVGVGDRPGGRPRELLRDRAAAPLHPLRDRDDPAARCAARRAATARCCWRSSTAWSSLGVAGATFFTVGSGNSWQGVLIGLANLAVAYLAWHRSTRTEIEMAERRRAGVRSAPAQVRRPPGRPRARRGRRRQPHVEVGEHQLRDVLEVGLVALGQEDRRRGLRGARPAASASRRRSAGRGPAG